jgi:hypothetical protein
MRRSVSVQNGNWLHQSGATANRYQLQLADISVLSGIGTVSALDRGNAANVTPNTIGAMT